MPLHGDKNMRTAKQMAVVTLLTLGALFLPACANDPMAHAPSEETEAIDATQPKVKQPSSAFDPFRADVSPGIQLLMGIFLDDH
jgi:hypothetical protein